MLNPWTSLDLEDISFGPHQFFPRFQVQLPAALLTGETADDHHRTHSTWWGVWEKGSTLPDLLDSVAFLYQVLETLGTGKRKQNPWEKEVNVIVILYICNKHVQWVWVSGVLSRYYGFFSSLKTCITSKWSLLCEWVCAGLCLVIGWHLIQCGPSLSPGISYTSTPTPECRVSATENTNRRKFVVATVNFGC